MSAGNIVDCWKRIGVHGDSSCQVLDEVSHCQYCSVYRSTATFVLDRAAPAEYIDEATRLAASPIIKEDTNYQRSLVFRIGNEWLALSADVCQEISTINKPHTIPGRRDTFILGLVNVRGELLISVSLERVVGIEAQVKPTADAVARSAERLIVISKDGDRFAFPATEVHGIVRHLPGDLQKLPHTLERSDPHFTSALLNWNEKSVGYLDDELLFATLNRGLA